MSKQETCRYEDCDKIATEVADGIFKCIDRHIYREDDLEPGFVPRRKKTKDTRTRDIFDDEA
tara:strand:+ start:7922 stop:8107 length:186 start_codon:yes stop_codon:yes gene_type:complete